MPLDSEYCTTLSLSQISHPPGRPGSSRPSFIASSGLVVPLSSGWRQEGSERGERCSAGGHWKSEHEHREVNLLAEGRIDRWIRWIEGGRENLPVLIGLHPLVGAQCAYAWPTAEGEEIDR